MDIKGKVLQILPIEGGTSKSGNQWQKASVIVELAENPKYPKRVKISNMKRADEFSKLPIGSEVNFKIEIESREFNGRWFTEVSCWAWDAPQNDNQPVQTAPSTPQPTADPDSDLPF